MKKLTPNDFSSNLPVKWCPGCGDYAILTAVKKAMAELEIEHNKYVVISGIGCSSRFPYYVNVYGYHTIHGRALPVATGVKLANPELMVFVITGDGDAMSIGGNHLIHSIRRNIGIKLLMFNNRIYALTKGQASPTTQKGSKTKTTPGGNLEYPINPVSFAISLGAPFVARCLDWDVNTTSSTIVEAAKNEGFAFVEVLQKCVVFTDKEFDPFRDPQTKDENLLVLNNLKPMIFGRNKDKAVVIENGNPRIVNFDPSLIPSSLTLYNNSDINMARIISSLMPPEFPLPVGVFFRGFKKSYENIYYDEFNKDLEDIDVLLDENAYNVN